MKESFDDKQLRIDELEKRLREAEQALAGLNADVSSRKELAEGEELLTDEESGAPAFGAEVREMRRRKELEISGLKKELEKLKI